MKIRKLVSVVLLAMLTLGNTVYAAETSTQFTLDSTVYIVDGQIRITDATPTLIDSRVYLPLRATTDALGIPDNNVTWDKTTDVVTIIDGSKTIKLKNNMSYITVDGKQIKMDGKVTSLNGRIYLPLSQIAKAFKGISVRWFPGIKSVKILRNTDIETSSSSTPVVLSDKVLLEKAGFKLTSINGLSYYEMPSTSYTKKEIYNDWTYDTEDGVNYIAAREGFCKNGVLTIKQLYTYSSSFEYQINKSIEAVEANFKAIDGPYILEKFNIIENDTTYIAQQKNSRSKTRDVYIFCKNSNAIFHIRVSNAQEFGCLNDDIWNAFIRTISY